MLRLDEQQCNNCGICHEVCPNYVMGRKEDPQGARIFLRYPDHCNGCGHCVAVCPKAALSHEAVPRGALSEIVPIEIEPESMQRLIFSRRSTRCFKADPVPWQVIEDLLEAATHSGSSGNLQAEDFIVITDAAAIRDLEDLVIEILWNGGLKYFGEKSLLTRILSKRYGHALSKDYVKYHKIFKRRREAGQTAGMIFRNAPALIIVHGLKADYLSHANCAIAVRNMELLALTMGLGTCWIGFLTSAAHMRTRKINRFLGLDRSRMIYGALIVGYPKYKIPYKIPRRKRSVLSIPSATSS